MITILISNCQRRPERNGFGFGRQLPVGGAGGPVLLLFSNPRRWIHFLPTEDVVQRDSLPDGVTAAVQRLPSPAGVQHLDPLPSVVALGWFWCHKRPRSNTHTHTHSLILLSL